MSSLEGNLADSQEEKNNDQESSQEELERQIEQEAEKFKISMDEIRKDIDVYGGVEKFKEYFEQQGRAGNLAGEFTRRSELNIEDANKEKKMNATAGSLVLAVNAIIAYGSTAQEGISTTNPIEAVQQAWEQSESWREQGMVAGTVAFVALLSVIGGGHLVAAIRSGIEERKEKRRAKKDELEFKMTGTEIQ